MAAPSQAILDSLSDTLETLSKALNYRDWLHEISLPHLGNRIIDVGSGVGTMTDATLDRELIVALEPESDYADRLRIRYQDKKNVQIWEYSATDPQVCLLSKKAGIDSAMSFNVFEHIEDDTAAFKVIYDSLPHGGKFVCFVPAMPILYGEMDKSLGHYRRYTKKELVNKATSVGFEIHLIHYMNLPGFFAWFINARVLKSSGVSGGINALRFYDAVIVRLTKLVERHIHPPFGQSLLLVALKP